jgi:hypothetical protein
VDETGKLSDLIGKDPTVDNLLSESELTSLRQEIKLFSKNFDETVFNESKLFETRIDTELAHIENRMIIGDIASLRQTRANDIVSYCRAANPGIVLYYQDGFEDYLASDLTPDDFDEKKYERKVILNDDLIEKENFVYKYVFDENWSVVILVPNDEVQRITSQSYVEVLFSKTQTSSWGAVKLINTYEDYSMVELTFTNSMVSFCKDRFVEVELILEEDKGLKIPKTAIGYESFYMIDKNFVTMGNNSANYGVLRREPDGDNVKFVEINIVKEDDDYYYVDPSSLQPSNVLIKPDTAQTTLNGTNMFVVDQMKMAQIMGVYNINKGFADFKQIEILYENDEYAIIKPTAAYGVRAYDFIALDAKTVTDKDFVY